MRVDSPTPESQAARRELSGLLEAAIDALPDGLREVFVLRAVEKMSVHDVSDALAIPDGTVKSRYARARVALQSDLLRRMETPLDAVFHFDGARCDGVTERVMARVRAEGR